MTTPTGNITIADVDAELQISDPQFLGTSAFRALAGVSSGPITLGQLRGKTRPPDAPPPPPPPSSGGGTPSNPFVPYGTFLYQACLGWQLLNYYADGNGGVYTTVADPTSVACGYNPNPARGQFLSSFCRGLDKYGRYTDGNGGAYVALIESDSVDCGFTPAFPAAGTLLSTGCGYVAPDDTTNQYTLYGIYADGIGGIYYLVMERYSTQCGAGVDPGGNSGG